METETGQTPGTCWLARLAEKWKFQVQCEILSQKKKVKGNREGYLALTSDPHMSMDAKYICIHVHIYVFLLDTCIHKYKLYVFLTDLQRMSFSTPCT